ncbi:uncharacterized [Tachysurus ichikawai]
MELSGGSPPPPLLGEAEEEDAEDEEGSGSISALLSSIVGACSSSSTRGMNSGWTMKLWMELLDSRPEYSELRKAFTTLIWGCGKSAECFDNRVAQIQADTFSLVEAKGVPMKRFRLGNRDKGSRESQDSHFLLQYRVGGTSESEVRRVRDLETGRVGGEEGAGKKSLEDG